VTLKFCEHYIECLVYSVITINKNKKERYEQGEKKDIIKHDKKL